MINHTSPLLATLCFWQALLSFKNQARVMDLCMAIVRHVPPAPNHMQLSLTKQLRRDHTNVRRRPLPQKVSPPLLFLFFFFFFLFLLNHVQRTNRDSRTCPNSSPCVWILYMIYIMIWLKTTTPWLLHVSARGLPARTIRVSRPTIPLSFETRMRDPQKRDRSRTRRCLLQIIETCLPLLF